MNTSSKLLVFLLALSMQTFCSAQEKDLASIHYNFTKLKYNDTIARIQQVDARFRLPLFQKNKNTAVLSANYKNVGSSDAPVNYPHSLHGISLQTFWLHRFTSQKSLTVFVQAGLFSDMIETSSKDFRYAAGFRYRYKHSDKFSTGWGLAYARQFFGNQVIPFIDMDYKPNDKWSISGQFPIKPKIMYHLNKKISTGIELSGEATSYRLSAREKNNQFIQINQWAGLGRLEYQFANTWQFNCSIGRNFRQSLKLYNDASTTPWTIITIPLGEKPEPVQKIDSKGLNIHLGISFNPLN